MTYKQLCVCLVRLHWAKRNMELEGLETDAVDEDIRLIVQAMDLIVKSDLKGES